MTTTANHQKKLADHKQSKAQQEKADSLLSSVAFIYKILWRYGRGRRGMMLLSVLLLLIAESMRLIQPWLAGSAINIIQSQGTTGMMEAGKYLVMIFGLILLLWCFQSSGILLARNATLHARAAFTLDLISRLLKAPLWWFRREHPTRVAQRVVQGTGALSDFGESQYIYVQTPVQIIGALLALTLISVWVGIAALVGVGILMFCSLRFDQIILRLNEVKNSADRRNAATLSDLLGNFLSLHALRISVGVLALIQKRMEDIFIPLRRVSVINELKWGSIDILGTLLWCSLVALYVVLAALDPNSSMIALGGVFMVYEYARRLEIEMTGIAADFSMMAQHMSGFRAVKPLLDTPSSEAVGTQLQPSTWQTLTLNDVCFQYAGQDKEDRSTGKLTELNLCLQRGRRYALIGGSGGGKSTLMLLLSGLESADSGTITLDGLAIDSVKLRREACLVPTVSALLEGNVIENVAPGFDDRSDIKTEHIQEVLNLVQLTEHVSSLADGMDSSVGQGSSQWSAGQQQRLALARGLLAAREASLVLLDESTSHLDESNSQKVLANLLDDLSGRTVIAAVHNLGLLKHFDEVIYLDKGRIIDVGAIHTLHGKYPELAQMLDYKAATNIESSRLEESTANA